MRIQLFVALAKHEKEIVLLGVNQNSRLIEILKESFMMRPDHIDWKAQTQTHELQIEWKEEKKNEAVPKEEAVSEQRKDVHAEVFGKTKG